MPADEAAALRLHEEAPLTDVHAHPSLKAYLFRRNLWRHYSSGGAFNPFASRTDFKTLAKGRVRVVWAAHYVPERQLFQRCFPLRVAAFLASPVGGRLTRGSLFLRLTEMMDALEKEVARKPDRTQMAHSAEEIESIMSEGKIAFIHTVEGGHVLEGRLENLDVLRARGVAMLTLAHFFPNGIAAPTNAIPTDMLIGRMCNFAVTDSGGLTSFGRQVVARMCELGMLIDISHCTPLARKEVLDLLDGVAPDFPVIASHVGVARLNSDPYNLTDSEIGRIADRGGAIGVIFMNYWLKSGHQDPTGLDVGLASIWETADHIHQVTGTWDNVMIGTDLDGFTDPPDDAKDASKLPRVTMMLLRMGLSEADVISILGRNAGRILSMAQRTS